MQASPIQEADAIEEGLVEERRGDGKVDFFSREWVRFLVGAAAAFALAPVAGMVLIFAVLPALPIGLFVGFVCAPDQMNRILNDRRERTAQERARRELIHRRALEREAQIYAGESTFGGRAHA